MSQKMIYRYAVPVDDQVHEFEMTGGQIVHVGCREAHVVEFWAQHYPWADRSRRQFRAFGTGEPMPDMAAVCGTAIDGPFVWHLAELTHLKEQAGDS